MKTIPLYTLCIILLVLSACRSDKSDQVIIPVPNGDFEQWDNLLFLTDWETNSCPPCVPAYDPYVVKRDSDAYHGKYAAQFIFNHVYKSLAVSKFAISMHPSSLTGCLKSVIASNDTVMIHIDIFSDNKVVDNLYETTSSDIYKRFEIPITNSSDKVDTVSITIVGGGKAGTVAVVDDLELVR